MTAQNLLLTAALIALTGAGVFEARVILRQRDELQTLQKSTANETWRVATLHREHDSAQQDLLAAEQQLAALPAPPVLDAGAAARQTEIKAWLARLKQLQRLVADRPEQCIPELQLLTDEDWLRVAQRAAFDDEHDMRRVLGELRTSAKSKFFKRVGEALRNYASTAGDETPSSILALAGHFEQPIDGAILQRYEVFKGSLSSSLGQVGLVVREKAPIDEDFDSRTEVSSSGGLASSGAPFAWPPDLSGRLSRAYRAYMGANNGLRPTSIEQALPYFDPPLAPSKVQAALRSERDRPPAGQDRR